MKTRAACLSLAIAASAFVLSAFAQTPPKKESTDARQKLGETEQAAAVGGVAAIRVKCDGDARNARVTVNGVFKGTCPMDLEVRPGIVVLQATVGLEDYYDRYFSVRFELGADVARTVDVVFDPATLHTLSGEAIARVDQQVGAEAVLREKQLQRAMPDLERAARSGDASAMTKLGRIWELGLAGPVNYSQALSWYSKASEAGDLSATTSLAILNIDGYGVPADPSKGATLLADAARKGDPEAMARMSKNTAAGLRKRAEAGEDRVALMSAGSGLLAGDDGFEKAPELGLRYCRMAFRAYKKSAATGDARALRELGNLYDFGICTARDTFAAESLYRQAIDGGDAKAQSFLKKLSQTTS